MIIAKRLIFGFLALFFISSLTRNILEYKNNLSFYENYKKEYEREKKRNISLKTQYIASQDAYEFEKTVRNKLNLHKPNEVVLIIPTPTPSVPRLSPTQSPPYIKWRDLFFSNTQSSL